MPPRFGVAVAGGCLGFFLSDLVRGERVSGIFKTQVTYCHSPLIPAISFITSFPGDCKVQSWLRSQKL